jgi:hypothetical protein
MRAYLNCNNTIKLWMNGRYSLFLTVFYVSRLPGKFDDFLRVDLPLSFTIDGYIVGSRR